MMNVWPTLGVLKSLYQGSKLSPRVKAKYQEAARTSEESIKIDLLVEAFELAIEDEPLVADARKGFASGAPTRHREMTAKAKMPVFEVRDRKSPAWRGAVVCPGDDVDAWLIFVDRHDQFHSSGPGAIASKKLDNKLGPSNLDRRIRDRCNARSEDRRAEKDVLRGLVDALQEIAKGSEVAQVMMPTGHVYNNAVVSLSVQPIVDEETGIVDAHEKLSSIRLEFRNISMDYEVRNDLLRICGPFLQPDQSLIEALYAGDLIVEIIVSQARLIHLLTLGEEEFNDHKDPKKNIPEPKTLHYTSKRGLTEAYVEGHAVRAVCGEWWIPTGDEETHAHLPVCAECEAQEPFAQAFVTLRRGGEELDGRPTTDL